MITDTFQTDCAILIIAAGTGEAEAGISKDEVSMTLGVNDRDIVLRSLELPKGSVDGDTALTLGRLDLLADGYPTLALGRYLTTNLGTF